MTDIAPAPRLGELVRELRNREFPWTAETIYLAAASIGPLPERARLAIEAFNAKRTAPHLIPDRDQFAIHAAARAAAAQLLNARAEEIALAPNTSTGLQAAAGALPLSPGDVVLVSDREFPANVYPWLARRRHGVVVERAPVTAAGFPDEDYLVHRLADPRVRVLSVSLVQFSNGYRADLARLGEACRANGSYLVVDAIQGLGVVPFDVRALPVDIVACGGQKWLLGPWGSGFCFVRGELVPQLVPAASGWLSYRGMDDFGDLLSYDDHLVDDARRFETASPATQDQLGLTASIGLLLDLGVEAIAAYLRWLGDPVLEWAAARGVPITSPTDPRHRSQIVCLAPPDAREAHRRLRQAGVVSSLREGSIRLAPHCYNTVEEMERVVEVLDEMMRER
ncbi:MAG TPA: aminotransferase class V-fold PLP-dependent enzyme [Gemmatimonadales bacterium]|nr:aminotransferase class V-fold PLP-dependent enzyme [Gemmatimonadales bacterium]